MMAGNLWHGTRTERRRCVSTRTSGGNY